MSHYSKASEEALLGCILAKPELFASVSALVDPADFFVGINKSVFEGMHKCVDSDQAIDEFTLSEAVGGESLNYIIDLSTGNATVKNYESYCNIIVDNSNKRKVHNAAVEAINLLADNASCEDVQDALSSALMDSTRKEENKPLSIQDSIQKLIERTESRFNGSKSAYKTGFKDLDDRLQMEGGRLILIAGRPGSGKSTLAQNIVENNCKAGVPCFISTMEMNQEEVVGRMIASQSGIATKFLADPKGYDEDFTDGEEQWSKFSVGIQQIKDWPLEIDYCPGLKVADFKAKARDFLSRQKAYTEDGKGILVIDYIGLMNMAGDNRVQSIGAITKALKTFAGEMKVPLILLAQLNRGLEQRTDKRPINSDLRDSGELEEDADQIMFVYRDEMYNEETNDKGVAEIIIGKNRGGSPGTVRVLSQLHRYRFTDAVAQYN